VHTGAGTGLQYGTGLWVWVLTCGTGMPVLQTQYHMIIISVRSVFYL